MIISYIRGNQIFYDEINDKWRYQEDETDINLVNEKPCIRCGKQANGADSCLKELEDCKFITSACCGHGVKDGYIMLADGRIFIEAKVVEDE